MSYQKDALRTKSDKFFGERVRYSVLMNHLSWAKITGEDIDAVKKSLFYGKNTRPEDEAEVRHNSVSRLMRGHDKSEWRDIIHGVLGVISESGEMAEAVTNFLDSNDAGAEFDHVNMAEEIGDVLWYLAILAEALGTTLESIQAGNIAKLRARYPDKFTEDKALNRDLSTERDILEGNPQHPCCVETPEELEAMRNGDYNAEELYGIGGKPSCPKCVK